MIVGIKSATDVECTFIHVGVTKEVVDWLWSKEVDCDSTENTENKILSTKHNTKTENRAK